MKITKRQLRNIIRETLLVEKRKGLWANIHAKKKRGEKSNPKSKSYKAAKKAGEKINEKLDPAVAAEAMAELKAEDAFDKIQNEATTAATIMANLSDDMDIPLMDAGLNELAMDLRKAQELCDKIRNAAYDLR